MARLGKRERTAKRQAMVERAKQTDTLAAMPWGVYRDGEIVRGAYKSALATSNLYGKTHHVSSYGANGGTGRVRETRDERVLREAANGIIKNA